jgi:CheY-like chemotaxis protein
MDRSILLVEDDTNDVFFLRRAIQRAGIPNPVQSVEDGRQAIHYLEGTGDYSNRAKYPLPCLVLLDLKLPYVMGLDVLKWIRTRPELRGIIVLILSASNLAQDIRKAYFLGANSYLVKPTDPDELMSLVRVIKNYWLDLNQSVPPLVHCDMPLRTSNTDVSQVRVIALG